MALPEDLQYQVEYHSAIEQNRTENMAAQDAKRAKLETLRMAKEVVMENNRTASAGTQIASTDITTMAAALQAYLDS